MRKTDFYRGKHSYFSPHLDGHRLPPILHLEQLQMLEEATKSWYVRSPKVIQECPILHRDEKLFLNIMAETMSSGKKKGFKEVCLSVKQFSTKMGTSRFYTEGIIHSLVKKRVIVVESRGNLGYCNNYRFTRFLFAFQDPCIRQEFYDTKPVLIYRPSVKNRISKEKLRQMEFLEGRIDAFLKKFTHIGGYLSVNGSFVNSISKIDLKNNEKKLVQCTHTHSGYAFEKKARGGKVGEGSLNPSLAGLWMKDGSAIVVCSDPKTKTPSIPKPPSPTGAAPLPPQGFLPHYAGGYKIKGAKISGFGYVLGEGKWASEVIFRGWSGLEDLKWEQVLGKGQRVDNCGRVADGLSVEVGFKNESGDYMAGWMCGCGARNFTPAENPVCDTCGRRNDEVSKVFGNPEPRFAWICDCGCSNWTTIDDMVCSRCDIDLTNFSSPDQKIKKRNFGVSPYGRMHVVMSIDDLPFSKKKQVGVIEPRSSGKGKWKQRQEPYRIAESKAEMRDSMLVAGISSANGLSSEKISRTDSVYEIFKEAMYKAGHQPIYRSLPSGYRKQTSEMIKSLGLATTKFIVSWVVENWKFISEADANAPEVPDFNYILPTWRHGKYLKAARDGDMSALKPFEKSEAKAPKKQVIEEVVEESDDCLDDTTPSPEKSSDDPNGFFMGGDLDESKHSEEVAGKSIFSNMSSDDYSKFLAEKRKKVLAERERQGKLDALRKQIREDESKRINVGEGHDSNGIWGKFKKPDHKV